MNPGGSDELLGMRRIMGPSRLKLVPATVPATRTSPKYTAPEAPLPKPILEDGEYPRIRIRELLLLLLLLSNWYPATTTTTTTITTTTTTSNYYPTTTTSNNYPTTTTTTTTATTESTFSELIR